MARLVAPIIRDASGAPREGLRVDFHAAPPDVSVSGMTDAGGELRVNLEPGVQYSVPIMNAVIVAGVALPAGTVLRIVVPEGEGPVSIPEVTVGVEDWSQPAIAARFAALETRLTLLEAM